MWSSRVSNSIRLRRCCLAAALAEQEFMKVDDDCAFVSSLLEFILPFVYCSTLPEVATCIVELDTLLLLRLCLWLELSPILILSVICQACRL